MAKSKSYPVAKNKPGERYAYGVPQSFVDRDLAGMKTAESLVPTPVEPVSLHKKMAGAC